MALSFTVCSQSSSVQRLDQRRHQFFRHMRRSWSSASRQIFLARGVNETADQSDSSRASTMMSAFGPKQTWTSAVHMSAFGGKADMGFCGANVPFDPKRIMDPV